MNPKTAKANPETARHWCFTIHEPSWDPRCVDQNKVRYMVCQEEIGADQASKPCPLSHWQGYICVMQPMRMPGLKTLLMCNSAHLEVRRGTEQEAIDYCTKMDTRKPNTAPFILGNLPSSEPKKRKADMVAELCVNAIKNNDLAGLKDEHPEIVFHNSKKIMNYVQLSDNIDRTGTKDIFCIFVHGSPGLGKTLGVVGTFSGDFHSLRHYRHDHVWFDGYSGQSVLLIDDVSQSNRPTYENMLHWCDRYQERVPVKGGMTISKWKVVIMTSNEPWHSVMSYDVHGALARRFHLICHLQQNNKHWIWDTLWHLCQSFPLKFVRQELIDQYFAYRSVPGDYFPCHVHHYKPDARMHGPPIMPTGLVIDHPGYEFYRLPDSVNLFATPPHDGSIDANSGSTQEITPSPPDLSDPTDDSDHYRNRNSVIQIWDDDDVVPVVPVADQKPAVMSSSSDAPRIIYLDLTK